MILLKVAGSSEVVIAGAGSTPPVVDVILGSRWGGGGIAPNPFDGGFFGWGL